MERSSVMSISLLVLACLLVSAAAQSFEDVTAHWADIDAKGHNWSMTAANVLCHTSVGGQSYAWRSQYNWTNIAGFSDPEDCGKCILVTNLVNSKEAIVRIVGPTGIGLELDKPVFDDLESAGTGANFQVNYKFVDCEPKPVPQPPPPPPPSPSPPPPPSPSPPPSGRSEFNVNSFWSDYDAESNNWTYPSSAVCFRKDNDKPLEWRKRYGWTGYCGKYLPQVPEDMCGKCLKVTNTGTGDAEIVRIMDTCGIPALLLDQKLAFNPIDTDGKGHAAGHLTVDYEFVNCDDDVDFPLLVYSE